LLIGFNLLRKIGAIINIEKGVLEYFDDKSSVNTDSLFVENSEKSLGTKNPGSANVEISVNKNKNILGIKNPENADVEISVNKNTNTLGIKNPESADVEISVNKNTNILGIKNPESADEVNTVK